MSKVEGNSLHTFFYQPAKLAEKPLSKAGFVALSIFTGIVTLGIGHLIAFALRNKFSKKLPGNANDIDTVAKKTFEETAKPLKTSKDKMIENMPKSPEVRRQKMKEFVDFFNQERVSQEGIFRIQGEEREMEPLAKKMGLVCNDPTKLNEEEPNTDENWTEKISIHNFATIFKRFIASCELFSDPKAKKLFIEAMNSKSEEEKRKVLNNAVNAMPEEKKELLKGLLSIIKTTAADNEKNLMTNSNLAIVFAPNLHQVNTQEETNSLNELITLLFESKDIL